MDLFRKEALTANQPKWLGEIILIKPISFTILTMIALIMAGSLCAFLTFASYTKRNTVSGQLVPEIGLIKVYTPQPGIVLEKFVEEGQQVQAGKILYVLSSERQSSLVGETQALISRQVEQRLDSLQAELSKTRALQDEELGTMTGKIASLQDEMAQVRNLINDQKDRVKLAEETVLRYQSLLIQEFISKEHFQQKNEELLDQKARFRQLERDQIRINREIKSTQADLSSLELKHHNQLALIERLQSSTKQELSESEAKRRLVVTSPQAGTATAVIAKIGQTFDASKPLVSIVPLGSQLRADLYVPSRSIGFIKPGDSVLIRYQAYPYQKFGHQQGVVESVAKAALPANELSNQTVTHNIDNQSLYLVTVKLVAQSVTAYGKTQALQPGMLLDADILLEKRKLYEWIFEPLYSLTGKF